MISAVGIVVPARNEGPSIGACLRRLRAALEQLPPGTDRAICVVADRCTDDTARLAHREFGGWSRGRVAVVSGTRTIGEVRELGVRGVRSMLPGHHPAQLWLLCTDADTTVAPDWARRHVHRAMGGSHAVAGTAVLADWHSLPPAARIRYRSVLADARGPAGHGNVYGANLGVRADAYAAVGGFRPLPTGEDHDLWRRLDEAGYRLTYAEDASVTTSSRLCGRAPGGLSDLLASLRCGTERARPASADPMAGTRAGLEPDGTMRGCLTRSAGHLSTAPTRGP